MISYKFILQLLFALIALDSYAQNTAIWTRAFNSFGLRGIALNNNEASIVVWGNALDTNCFEVAPGIIKLDPSGNVIIDTLYDFNNCSAEGGIQLVGVENEFGYFLITDNNVSTPQDSSFVHYIDFNHNIVWSIYIGETVRSNLASCRDKYFVSSDNFSGIRQVLDFNLIGILDTLNDITLPYYVWAPNKIMCENGLVLEVGNQVDLDTAFMCLVYDTSGTYFANFTFDADMTKLEVPWFAALHNNQLFHVSCASSSNKTYPAASGVTGVTNWIDTLYHRMHSYGGACIDTINNVGFVLCDTPTPTKIMFSYDLFTGNMIDSITIDSVDAQFSGIKSGPAGGVYLCYNKMYLNRIYVNQYDVNLNLLWEGFGVHPTCSSPCDVLDFAIDSVGNVYTSSYCGGCLDSNVLVSKYGTSLIGIPESAENITYFNLFPNPAFDEITLSVSECNSIHYFNLYNSTGKLLQCFSFKGCQNTISTDNLASGLYLMEMFNDQGHRSTHKLIIQPHD